MLIFYGCARKHRIQSLNDLIITNDIDSKCHCNITMDIRELIKEHKFMSKFDGLIFTPPCNYYSHANWRRESSRVALETKDILPLVLEFCVNSDKYWIVENVQNSTFFKDLYPQFQFIVGGHTYWSNLLDRADFDDDEFIRQNKQHVCRNKRDNNFNVDLVLKRFIECIPIFD